MPLNTLWNITFGPYAFTLDRTTLTYDLVETQTGTIWANNFSLGWIEIEERTTGTITRHDFGTLKLISLSEKAGAQGKRILFGLDAPGGVPLDVYLTCTDREIQLTVEANRDTRTHRIGAIGLLPGLCAIRDDGESYLVIPIGEGAILFAKDAPEEGLALQIWNPHGLTMPFIGAIKAPQVTQSSVPLAPTGSAPPKGAGGALALLTDSAYAVADLTCNDTTASLDLRYDRDPERRRLDVRIVPLPEGDPISIARAYRDKIIGEGVHVPLRKKLRERPTLKEWFDHRLGQHEGILWLPKLADPLSEPRSPGYWEEIETRIETVRNTMTQTSDEARIVGTYRSADWSASVVDFWEPSETANALEGKAIPVPLQATIYHDAVPTLISAQIGWEKLLVQALLPLNPVCDMDQETDERIRDLFTQLNPFCFTGYLTEHRFLTPSKLVQEARHSNGAHIIINASPTEAYKTNDLHLPPLGFYISHPQITVHNARQVGNEVFPEQT